MSEDQPFKGGLRELALFAGGGGGILGGKILGWRTVCAVEIEDSARRMLMARQDDGSLPAFPIWDDVRTFDGRAWRGVVDIITGGFPCQDISVAGTGMGLDGSRSGLWREQARIIGEVRPRYVLVENSPALRSRGMGIVLGDLAAMGYDVRWGVLGAVDAGAPHKRDRIWIIGVLADAPHDGPGWGEQQQERGEGAGNVADTEGIPVRSGPCEAGAIEDGVEFDHGGDSGSGPGRVGWWESEPDVGRVADGVAARVDRLAALGNGQVPAVVFLAWYLMAPKHLTARWRDAA